MNKLKDIQKQIENNAEKMNELDVEWYKNVDNKNMVKDIRNQYFELEHETSNLTYDYMHEYIRNIKNDTQKLYDLLTYVVDNSEDNMFYLFEEFNEHEKNI